MEVAEPLKHKLPLHVFLLAGIIEHLVRDVDVSKVILLPLEVVLMAVVIMIVARASVVVRRQLWAWLFGALALARVGLHESDEVRLVIVVVIMVMMGHLEHVHVLLGAEVLYARADRLGGVPGQTNVPQGHLLLLAEVEDVRYCCYQEGKEDGAPEAEDDRNDLAGRGPWRYIAVTNSCKSNNREPYGIEVRVELCGIFGLPQVWELEDPHQVCEDANRSHEHDADRHLWIDD